MNGRIFDLQSIEAIDFGAVHLFIFYNTEDNFFNSCKIASTQHGMGGSEDVKIHQNGGGGARGMGFFSSRKLYSQ